MSVFQDLVCEVIPSRNLKMCPFLTGYRVTNRNYRWFQLHGTITRVLRRNGTPDISV